LERLSSLKVGRATGGRQAARGCGQEGWVGAHAGQVGETAAPGLRSGLSDTGNDALADARGDARRGAAGLRVHDGGGSEDGSELGVEEHV